MARDLFNRYLWLVDTLRSYGALTRARIDELWQQCPLSDGRPMPRRTFCNYREAAEKFFDIDIKVDPATHEYYIAQGEHNDSMQRWLLNNAATHRLLTDSRDVAHKIMVDDVPSAREYLAPAIEALRGNRRVRFDYMPFYRLVPTADILLEPYLVKLFRQRWYLVGRHVAQNRIKTYALDRISKFRLLTDTFEPDPTFDGECYFAGAFGIVADEGELQRVVLRVQPGQAKYFRALPLHASQEEFVHDNYSDFHYIIRPTRDFVEEILSHGPRVQVIAPPELRDRVRGELEEALKAYQDKA